MVKSFREKVFVISKYTVFQNEERNKHFLILYIFAFISWVNIVIKEWIALTKGNLLNAKVLTNYAHADWAVNLTPGLWHRHFCSLGFS